MSKFFVAGIYATTLLGAEAGELRGHETPAARLRKVTPLAWVHAPNSGTTFVNSLIHTPGMCSEDTSDELLKAEGASFWGGEGEPVVFHKNQNKHGHVKSHHEKRHDKHVKKRVARRAKNAAAESLHAEEADDLEVEESLLEVSRHPGASKTKPGTLQSFAEHFELPRRCHKGLSKNYLWWTHKGFGPYYEAHEGKGVMLMRQPEQRILSSWFHSESWWKKKTLPKYAKMVSGCVVKMLTRDHQTPCEDPNPPTTEEMQMAKTRLTSGFAFIGMADEWTLSIGLWHKMYGGVCRDFELLDQTAGQEFQGYDAQKLEGYTDPYDGELYEEAKKLFNANIEKYGVNRNYPLADCAPSGK